jgi:hypothetical protein
MTIDAWISAAHGDASGLWFLSLMAKMAFPEAVVWGEFAAVARADNWAADRYFGKGLHRKDSILGNAGTELIFGGGGLMHAFPPAPDSGEYSKVQDSNVETLLVNGTLGFATPAKFGIQELLPHLRNGRKVVLAELGHSGTFWTYQPEASTRLLNTYFDTGRVDTSLYTPAKVDFTPEVTHTALGKGFAATLFGLRVIVILSLLLMRRRVRRRGRFGRRQVSCCVLCTRSCWGSAAGSPVSSSCSSRSRKWRSTTRASPSSRSACRSASGSISPGSTATSALGPERSASWRPWQRRSLAPGWASTRRPGSWPSSRRSSERPSART